MAEMPLIPLAPAVSAAVFDAVGVWFDELPLTPERISACNPSNTAPDQPKTPSATA